jgi:membrane associated rhomboid family serine protease
MLPLSDGLPARRFAGVTLALIAASVVVWVLFALPDLDGDVLQAAFYPCGMTGTCQAPLPWAFSWYTAIFMHASWGHLLGNMLFLAIFGNNVEDAFGHLRYLVFYVAGGSVALALQTGITLLFGPAASAWIPMVGASGAVSAVLGAYLVLHPHARIRTLLGIFVVRIPARLYLGGWFLYQLVQARYALAGPVGTEAGVAFFAHVGGFALGWVVARRWRDMAEIRTEPIAPAVGTRPSAPWQRPAASRHHRRR